MSKPIVGLPVWFFEWDDAAQGGPSHIGPSAATIAWVYSDTLVNLMVIDGSGWPRPMQRVPLIQEGEQTAPCDYCCFPFLEN